MADDDASGRFDKQNERGGETSAEGKSTGLFVVLWQGRTNCWLRARIISCIGCVHRYTLIEKVVSRESCKKLRFKRPRFTLKKLTLRSHRNLSSMEGKGSSRTKENARFLFSFHTPRENGRSSALIRFLFEKTRFEEGHRAVAKGMVFPGRENDPNLLQLLLFSVCWNFPTVIVKLLRYNPFRSIFINESKTLYTSYIYMCIYIYVKNHFEIVCKLLLT